MAVLCDCLQCRSARSIYLPVTSDYYWQLLALETMMIIHHHNHRNNDDDSCWNCFRKDTGVSCFHQKTMAEEEGRKFGWWWSPFRGAQVFLFGNIVVFVFIFLAVFAFVFVGVHSINCCILQFAELIFQSTSYKGTPPYLYICICISVFVFVLLVDLINFYFLRLNLPIFYRATPLFVFVLVDLINSC